MAYGIINGMNLKIDQAGRIVVPKPIRERLGLRPDTEIELVEQGDGLLLRVVAAQPSLIKADGVWVHTGQTNATEELRHVVDESREERLRSLLKPSR
jgi:AbrB family looped-hinge helix DNA binding protein